MRRFTQRAGYPSAGLAIVVLMGLLGFTGHGLNALAVRTLNGEAWLVNTVYRSVSLIDGYSGKAAAQVSVRDLGSRPVVINSPSGAIVVGANGRMVKVSDASFTTRASVQLFGGDGSASAVGGGQNALYAVDLTSGEIQRLDDSGPRLVPDGPLISARAPITSPIVGPDGSLYVAISRTGTVEHLVEDRLVPVDKIGRRGDQLKLVLAGTVPVAINLTAGTLVQLGAQRPIGGVVHVPAGFDGTLAAGSDTIPGLVGLVGSRSVVSVNLVSAAVTNTALRHPVDALATVMRGSSVVFIDNNSHQVLIVNTRTHSVRRLTMPQHQIPDQLTIQDRLVFVNASGSPGALVINGGRVQKVKKYSGPPPVQPRKSTPPSAPTSVPTPHPNSSPSSSPPTAPVHVQPSGSPTTPGSPNPKPSTPTHTPTPPPKPKPPGAPQDVAVSPGNGQVTLGWNPAAANGRAITHYQVAWTAGPGGQSGHTVLPGNSRGLTVQNLVNGVGYKFAITAVNAVGQGPPVHTGLEIPRLNVPGAPLNVTAATPDDGSVILTWTASDHGSDISGYWISLAGSNVTVDKATGTRAVLPEGSPDIALGVPVRFQVIAIGSNGTASAPSQPSAAVTPYLPPAAPTVNVASLATDGTSAALSVSCSSTCQQGRPVATYQVTVGPDGTQTNVKALASGAAVSVPITGLAANSSYTAQVIATDNEGKAGAEADVTIATPGKPTVTNVTATAASGYTKTLGVSADVNTGGLSSTTCSVSVPGVPTVTGSCTNTFTVVVPMYNTSYTTTFTATNPDGSSYGDATVNSGLKQLTADATDAFGACPGAGKYCGGDSDLEPTPKWSANNGAPIVRQGTPEQADCWSTGATDYGYLAPYNNGSNEWVHISTPSSGWMSILWFPNPDSVTSGLPHCG